jgi:hypothetical protein
MRPAMTVASARSILVPTSSRTGGYKPNPSSYELKDWRL